MRILYWYLIIILTYKCTNVQLKWENKQIPWFLSRKYVVNGPKCFYRNHYIQCEYPFSAVVIEQCRRLKLYLLQYILYLQPIPIQIQNRARAKLSFEKDTANKIQCINSKMLFIVCQSMNHLYNIATLPHDLTTLKASNFISCVKFSNFSTYRYILSWSTNIIKNLIRVLPWSNLSQWYPTLIGQKLRNI